MDANQNFGPTWQVRLAFGAGIGFIVGMFGWMLVFIAFGKATVGLLHILGGTEELHNKYQFYVFNGLIVAYFCIIVDIGMVLMNIYFISGFLATLPLFIFVSLLMHMPSKPEHMLAISGFVMIFMLLIAIRYQGN
jgi:hypothetical protein